MASKRQSQVGEMIKRHFGPVLQAEGAYVYGGEPFVTVTNVIMTPDLALAKIYLSVYNVEDKQGVVDQMSKHMRPLKQALVTRIRRHIRRIPELAFYLDETLDEMYHLNAVFDNLQSNKQEEE